MLVCFLTSWLVQVIVVDADKGREEMEEEFRRQGAIILGGDKENQGARGARALKRVVDEEGGREVKRVVEEEGGRTRQPFRVARDN